MAPSSSRSPVLAAAATAALAAACYLYGSAGARRRREAAGADDRPHRRADGDTAATVGDAGDGRVPPGMVDVITIQAGGADDPTSSRHARVLSPGTVTVAYSSKTGTCGGYASRLRDAIAGEIAGSRRWRGRTVQLLRVEELDWWDELTNDEDAEQDGGNGATAPGASDAVFPVLLLVLPTWTGGTLPPESSVLLESLQEIATDWRVAPEPLRSSDPGRQLKVAAFGMGSSAYDASTVGRPAKEAFASLVGKLGARPLVGKKVVSKTAGGRKGKSLMVGDAEVGDAGEVYEKWAEGVLASIFPEDEKKSRPTGKAKKESKSETTATCGDGKDESDCACKSESKTKNHDAGCCSAEKQSDEETDSLSADEDDEDDGYDSSDDIVDLEDMGDIMKSQQSSKSKEPVEMVTPRQAKALKKEGYKLIGTHSAVKLCRWTKHQLRGRGGCYKHTHYGITSYQCMEATPSLACANKCVFCWRHHKNPVGREWRWKTDEPAMIVEEAVNTHVDMIRETRGIPGIRMDRWEEAHTVRHCALSLVGEPIMYPKINELLEELHDRDISTFLVTNGQHPKAIEDLIPITQLVS